MGKRKAVLESAEMSRREKEARRRWEARLQAPRLAARISQVTTALQIPEDPDEDEVYRNKLLALALNLAKVATRI